MLGLENSRRVGISGGMPSIYSTVRPSTERFEPNAKFFTYQIEYEIFEVGPVKRGEVSAQAYSLSDRVMYVVLCLSRKRTQSQVVQVFARRASSER